MLSVRICSFPPPLISKHSSSLIHLIGRYVLNKNDVHRTKLFLTSPTISALRMLRQEDGEFEANLSYIATLLKKH